MTFFRNALESIIGRIVTVVLLTVLLAMPVFAARIDDGGTSTKKSTAAASKKAKVKDAAPAAEIKSEVIVGDPQKQAVQDKAPAASAQAPDPAAADQPASQAQEQPADSTGPSSDTNVRSDRAQKDIPADRESRKKTPAEPVGKRKVEKYVTLDFDNVNIEVFVKFVSELTGKNFIIDDKVKGKVTIYSPKKILLRDVYKVFLSVLEINGYATVPVGDMVKIVPSAVAREKSVETRTKKDGVESDDRIVTQIISLERANPDEVKRVLDPIVSRTSSVLSYPPAGVLIITDYLSNIRRLQEIIKELDVEGAGEQITYQPLQNASASEVVKSLAAVFQQRRANAPQIRLVADTRTNSVIILASVGDTESVRKLIALMDKDVPRGESNIQVYRLQNAVAEDLAKVLNSIIKETGASTGSAAQGATVTAIRAVTPVVSKNVQIVPDKATNTLVIMAEREDYKVLENIIKQLDVPRAMVYIEALIMEVNTTKDFKLGVEWRGLKETGSVDGTSLYSFAGSGTGVMPSASYDSTSGLTSLALGSGLSMGILGSGIKIGSILFPTIGAVVQAYKEDSDVSILSTPQLLTLDNEEAEINVGSNVPYITKQESTTTSTLVNYNSYEYKDVGVILNITPHINEGNFVRLKISQQVTKVQSGADKSTPTTLKRVAKTTVVVKDNETVVIGGLVGDSTDAGVVKVPLL
ncbi:MAG TPA: type II secretion system secretin GspD, partial [Smithellaceae bacterium]|nr:type II secretion system secretin GspD [Smithellaceae bacterium]